jgi:hypothetical protein
MKAAVANFGKKKLWADVAIGLFMIVLKPENPSVDSICLGWDWHIVYSVEHGSLL